jgi:HKD family nuclease
MILDTVLLSFLVISLGADKHKQREQAQHLIITSQYSFNDVMAYYKLTNDPEINLRLYDILRHKYYNEYSELHTDYYDEVNMVRLEYNFKLEMKLRKKQ